MRDENLPEATPEEIEAFAKSLDLWRQNTGKRPRKGYGKRKRKSAARLKVKR